MPAKKKFHPCLIFWLMLRSKLLQNNLINSHYQFQCFFPAYNWAKINGEGDKTSITDSAGYVPIPIDQWRHDKLAWFRASTRHSLPILVASLPTIRTMREKFIIIVCALLPFRMCLIIGINSTKYVGKLLQLTHNGNNFISPLSLSLRANIIVTSRDHLSLMII